MSSMFIYNTKNAVSSDAFNKLSFITKIKESIKLSEHTTGKQDLSRECPDFIWVVRDFFLEKTKSANESLAEFLRLESESDDEDEDAEYRNTIRQSFLSTFNSHSCCYIVEPELNENSSIRMSRKDFLRNLDTIPISELSDEFQWDIRQLSEQVQNNIRPKQVGDVLLDGQRYAQFLRLAVDAVNKGQAFYLMDAITRVTALEYFAKLKHSYAEKLKYLTSRADSKPISVSELRENAEAIFDESIGVLKAVLNNHRLEQEFMPKFEAFCEETRRAYESIAIDQASKYNRDLLYGGWERFKSTQCDPTRLAYRSMVEFENDITKLKDLYMLSAVDSDDLDSIWNELLPSIDQARTVVRDELENRRKLEEDLQIANQLQILDQSTNTDQYSSEEQDEEEDQTRKPERCVPRDALPVDREYH